MQLGLPERLLSRQLELADARFADYLRRTTKPPTPGPELHELEGWLSELWQAWCHFCRRVVMASCTGGAGTSGAPIAATHTTNDHVSFIAAKQKRGVPPTTLGTNTVLRHEPTWGHVDKLLEVMRALAPANYASLTAAFGTVPDIEHIRLIRNAAAHLNPETLADVRGFQSAYMATPISHPLHALLWTDRATGKTLAQARIDDMRIAARNACA
jgi:hypothetical protein